MIVGVPREIKPDEYRAAMTPAGVDLLTKAGHTVLVETNACAESGITDAALTAAGATIAATHGEIFERAGLVVKVKEPMESEYGLFRPGQALFTYLHLAADRKLVDAMLKARVLGIAYETVEL